MKENDTIPSENTEILTTTIENTDLPESNSQEDFSSDEDGEVRKPEDWEGEEAEIVLDDEAEEYEEEETGVKIKYKLNQEEIKSFIKHSESYERNKKAQNKHTVIQGVVFALMIVLSFLSQNMYYLLISLFPLVALVLIWVVPMISIKNVIKKVLLDKEITAEVFPDKIEVCKGSSEREILLDGTCDYREYDNLISISSAEGNSLVIPLRAIEPEFRAEVQAMILAGSKTKEE